MKSEVALFTMVPTEDELESMGEVGVESWCRNARRKGCAEETVRVRCGLDASMELVNVVDRVRV